MSFLVPALVFAALPAFLQRDGSGAQVTPRVVVGAPATHLDRKGSERALKFARKSQRDFEFLRRRLLPRQEGLAGRACDVVIGRYCQYQQDEPGPPAEEPKVIARREKLLHTLDSLGRLMPDDRWILGQRMRYLIEAERQDDADVMASNCATTSDERATRAWCRALIGYSAQRRGDYERADAAFTLALSEMEEKERCGWQDLSIILDGDAARRYKRLSCAERDSSATAFFRLVQPLYLTGVNDLRTEFYARVTRLYIEKDTPTPMSTSWGDDDRETLMRYGGGLWYTQEIPAPGSGASPVVASHKRGPSFNFFPQPKAIVSPDELRPEDWVFVDVTARTRYAPEYMQAFNPLLEHQVALFRRGDSALVVAAFDVTGYGAFDNSNLRAGVFAAVLDSGRVSAPLGGAVKTAGTTSISMLRAPWRPLLVSLEVFDGDSHAAGRARYSVRPPPGGRLSLSDIMLYTPRDSMPLSLAEAMPMALRGLRVPNSRRLGLFWEMYGVRPEGEVCDFAVLVEPIGQSWVRKAFTKLKLLDETKPLSVQWRESPKIADGVASRSLNVEVSTLKPGRYRVRLSLTPTGGTPVITYRDIEILN